MDTLRSPTCRATRPPVSPRASGLWNSSPAYRMGTLSPKRTPSQGLSSGTFSHPQALQQLPPLPAASSRPGGALCSPFLTTPGPSQRPGGFGGPSRRRRRLPDASSRRVRRASPPFASVASRPSTARLSPETVGQRRGLRRLPVLFRPSAALGPSPGAGDTSEPGTMADAAWLRASAPLRGLLSRDCTGGARGAGLACADRRAEGRGLGVTKRTGPPT